MDIAELALGLALTSSAVEARLDVLRASLRDTGLSYLGDASSWEAEFSELADLLTLMPLNNGGDPWEESAIPHHTKVFEREVLALFAHLFRAPGSEWWGYVTSGTTEALLHALRTARRAYPQAMAYFSQAAHSCVAKTVDLLGMSATTIPVAESGEMLYSELQREIGLNRRRPAVVVATVGTPQREAVDDVRVIASICDSAGVERYIHSDAAVSGLPLAFSACHDRPGFDLADGADSISVSGHKFLPAMPCAIYLSRRSWIAEKAVAVEHLGAADSTISGSRNGHTPLQLWHVLAYLGIEGLGLKVKRAQANARYLAGQLADLGWPCFRAHRDAVTVVFRAPPAHVTRPYSIATSGGWAKIVCVPGVTRLMLDEFAADLAKSLHPSESAA